MTPAQHVSPNATRIIYSGLSAANIRRLLPCRQLTAVRFPAWRDLPSLRVGARRSVCLDQRHDRKCGWGLVSALEPSRTCADSEQADAHAQRNVAGRAAATGYRAAVISENGARLGAAAARRLAELACCDIAPGF